MAEAAATDSAKQADAAVGAMVPEGMSHLRGGGTLAYSDNIRIVYKAEIDEKYPMLQLCGCGPCCAEKLMERTYVHVHENRIEANYPMLVCCGLFLCDCATIKYFDTPGSGNFTEQPMCTPGHFFGILPCGQVAKDPWCAFASPFFWNILCCCMPFNFYVGLKDAKGFCGNAQMAYDAWKAKTGAAPAQETMA